MLLPSKDGIACDWCGRVLKEKFEYYSIACTRVHVDKDKAETNPVEVDDDILDFDICVECHSAVVTKAKAIDKEINNE